MSYLRHAPLAFWAAAVSCLAALLFVGFAQTTAVSGVSVAAPVPYESAEERAYSLVEQVPSVTAAVMTGKSVQWANDFAEEVQVAAAEYEASEGRTPALDGLWGNTEDAAAAFARYRGDEAIKRQALVTELGTAVFALAAYYRTNP